MRASLSLLGLLGGFALSRAQTTGKLGDAVIVTNNPPGVEYAAKFTGSITGWANASSAAGGKGVSFNISVSGLPTEKGPFKYHIHVNPVPSDGNCTGTGGHLDPFQREDTPACDSTKPATCEVGDLSGKYGTVTGPVALKSFVDLYTALVPTDVAFFGNRSIVFHDASSARIACANFTLVEPVE
ncbi:hypothetical protein NKR23_g5237 [Pleurostoma richardsiae]|uniref:superoxide dismutase n=1 Tax=Pleurostoma richardsiae TaxID=41990 RepID=A0AA38VUI0_9PEZI|nr:hypothetical protein NKR23_g5237 [Pleurostoma richardsiae]